MQETSTQSFFDALVEAGVAFDATPVPNANLTGHARTSQGVVRPYDVEQVRQVVDIARRFGVPLYPYSSGFNWGYGSASPVTAGCVQVELSGMKAIRNAKDISVDNPVAVLEPGVTQGQLADFLAAHHPDLIFNVTGSARETSVLGASLERAVGYFGPRRDDLFGLEVVTGAGELLLTGFRRLGEDSPIAHCHPYGLGPQLEGLFFQGNFGIVTSACFRLMPRRERHVAVSIGLRQEADLPFLIDTLAQLKRTGVLPAVTHIGNRARTHATLSENIAHFLQVECGVPPEQLAKQAAQALDKVSPFPWTGLAGLLGTRAQVRAAVQAIRAALGSRARVQVVSDRLLDLALSLKNVLKHVPALRPQLAAAAAIKPLHGLATGVPSSVAVENLVLKYPHAGKAGVGALDASRCGLLFISPVLPLKGELAVRVVKRLEETAARFGHTLYITLNIETELSQVAVINLLFDRSDPAEADKAHACADALHDVIEQEGLSPYRARVDMMARLTADTRGASQGYWQHVAALKQVFDPDGIIAPGRYDPR